MHMGTGAGGIEHDVDVGEFGHAGEVGYAFVRGGHAHASGTGQAVGGGIDADHDAHFDVLAMAQDLYHQVRADVAAANDGGFECVVHEQSVSEDSASQAMRQLTLPNAPIDAWTASPA